MQALTALRNLNGKIDCEKQSVASSPGAAIFQLDEPVEVGIKTMGRFHWAFMFGTFLYLANACAYFVDVTVDVDHNNVYREKSQSDKSAVIEWSDEFLVNYCTDWELCQIRE